MAEERVITPTSGVRIAKAIARAGLASRREAEAWIAAGRVAVNGTVITSPAMNVGERDRVAVDGKPLPQRERTRLFLFHKPRGLVTTSSDPQGRPTIFGALPGNLPRLISVGRLDLNTEGLLLLTNDGGLARALELPATGWLRRYRVRAHGEVKQSDLDRLRGGITVDGVRYGPIEASLDSTQGSNVWLTFAIREGKNREVRNVLGALGLKVARLIRVSFGPFQLGELPPGATEEVKTRHLREQLGEKLAALAGADFSGPVGSNQPSSAAASRGPIQAPRLIPPAQREGGSAQAERQRRDARGRLGAHHESQTKPHPAAPRSATLRDRGREKKQSPDKTAAVAPRGKKNGGKARGKSARTPHGKSPRPYRSKRR
jgi:23S rRNA pseudouridine2605 synthase